mmetsp:Transcript_118145/g.329434  ORF Transcript_118145/g.329434 Transcript_118145/m.329434 type:complete len:801 (+) Transcript_118145:70-2472(+)
MGLAAQKPPRLPRLMVAAVAAAFVVVAFAASAAAAVRPPQPLCPETGAAEGWAVADDIEASALLQVPVPGRQHGHWRILEEWPTESASAPSGKLFGPQGPKPSPHSHAFNWNTTASDLVGVERNKKGDLGAFFCNLGVNIAVVVGCFVAFSFLRHWYPPIFSNNVLTGAVPKSLFTDSLFGWFRDSLSLSSEEIERAAGLDAAMLVEFFVLCMRILSVIAVPMICLAGPFQLLVGGIGNVTDGRRLCWLHALLVWYIIGVTEYFIIQSQRAFVERRNRWVKAMPAPQSTTVLVEGIPPDFCTDEALLRKFRELFGADRVESASVVRITGRLTGLLAEESAAEQALHQAEFQWERDGRDPERRPHFHNMFGELKDAIEYYGALKRETGEAIIAERHRILVDCTQEVNTSSGFVTFKYRRDQELALMVNISFDLDEFVVSLPPDPSDVIYTDLAEDPNKRTGRELMGYSCIVGLYIGFMPFVVAASQLTNVEMLANHSTLVAELLLRVPSAKPFIHSMAAAVALKFFMMFLPTFLMVIFHTFFCLRAEAWAQHKLQSSYFWFLAIFEIMVTSVGSSLTRTTSVLMHHPLVIIKMLGETLPFVTHFYLNFMVIHWSTHALNLTRYFNLMKFLTLRTICEQERARQLAEPEDQDWYGMGGRSARFTECMVIALIFSNLAPSITVLTLINFFMCRVVYGYLLVFAETRKPDLGGYFWVTQLDHLQKGLLIYVLTMVGVLARTGHSRRPAGLALTALALWAVAYRRMHAMRWRSLPLEELGEPSEHAAAELRSSLRGTYVQPELLG